MEIIYEGNRFLKEDYLAYKKKNLTQVGSSLIHMHRSPDMLFAIYMLWEEGITYIPVDYSTPKERLDLIVEQVNAESIVSDTGIRRCLDHSSGMLYGKNDLAYIAFTSGSTGTPKGIDITRGGVQNFIDGICDRIDFSENKHIACFTNIAFDIFFLESILPLSRNMSVVLANEIEQRNPRRMAKLIYDNKIEIIQMTPSRMQLLLNFDPSLESLRSVETILLGGESLPNNLLVKLQEKTTAKIYNLYGPTETTIYSTISDLTLKETVDIGTPIKNTKIVLLNPTTGEICTDSEEGQICIGGAGVALGYHNNTSLTKEKFKILDIGGRPDRFFFTGDRGVKSKDGSYHCLGRIDNQIKLNGYRIEPEEIEFYLGRFSGVEQCVVKLSAYNSTPMLEAIYTGNAKKDALQDYLCKKLPSYMIPRIYKRIERFRYTANGKIDRNNPV